MVPAHNLSAALAGRFIPAPSTREQGKYPTQAVGTMNKIVHQAEVWTKANPIDASVVQIKPEGLDTAHGVAYAIAEASKNLHAKCIIVLAVTGQTAANIAAYRPNVPIVTFVPEAKTACPK